MRRASNNHCNWIWKKLHCFLMLTLYQNVCFHRLFLMHVRFNLYVFYANQDLFPVHIWMVSQVLNMRTKIYEKHQIHVSNQISLLGASTFISRITCNGYKNRSNFYSKVITYTCKTIMRDMSTCTTIFGSEHLHGYALIFLEMMH